ncbi:MAG: hypothetical protein LQ340_003115 [Diploschistes diacapsis]|nr:MAG: hypothetical protein LQ340_003115 [Diploschistes diacapsis]
MVDSRFRTVLLPEAEGSRTAMSAEIYEPPEPKSQHSTFLLLPFWGGSASTYSVVQHSLVAKYPHNASIAISYHGTGNASAADPSDDDAARHSIQALTNDLLRFLQSPELNQLADTSSLTICAHSMSAKVALRLASTLPPDAGIRVHSLLLLGPAPPGPLVLPPDVRKGQLTAYDSVDSARWTIENVLAHSKLDDDAMAQLAANCVAMSPGAKKGWIEIGMAESLAELLEGAGAERRTFPVRVLAGVCDRVETLERVEGETVARLREYGFDVALTRLEDCGHLVPLEKPEAVVEQLGILARVH